MADTYDIGDAITATAIFTNAAGTPTAPTTITFRVKDPTGTEVSTVSPNSAITNPSTGVYVFAVPTFTLAGSYAIRAVGTGTVGAASERYASVRSSVFATP